MVPTKLRADVLKLVHDDPSAGHGGFYRTYIIARRRYYWDRMQRDIFKYVQVCQQCQQHNPRNAKPEGLQVTYPPPARVFSRIAVDYVGPLPKTSRGNQYALVVIDYTSRFLWVLPTRTAAASDSVRLLQRNLFDCFGYVREVVSDGGTHFTGQEFRSFLKNKHIKHIVVPPYSPQSNGAIERSNRDTKNTIRKYLDKSKTSWDLLCNQAAFNHNNHHHDGLNSSPYFLFFGRQPILQADLATPVIETPAEEDLQQQQQQHSQAIAAAVSQAQRKQEVRNQRANQGRRAHSYQVGDYIAIRTNQHGFRAPWSRPHRVVAIVGQTELIVEDVDPSTNNKTRRVHVNNIKRWNPADPWCRDYGYLKVDLQQQQQQRRQQQQQANVAQQQDDRSLVAVPGLQAGNSPRIDHPRRTSSVRISSRSSVSSLSSEVDGFERKSRSLEPASPTPQVASPQYQTAVPRRHKYNTRQNAGIANQQIVRVFSNPNVTPVAVESATRTFYNSNYSPSRIRNSSLPPRFRQAHQRADVAQPASQMQNRLSTSLLSLLQQYG